MQGVIQSMIEMFSANCRLRLAASAVTVARLASLFSANSILNVASDPWHWADQAVRFIGHRFRVGIWRRIATQLVEQVFGQSRF